MSVKFAFLFCKGLNFTSGNSSFFPGRSQSTWNLTKGPFRRKVQTRTDFPNSRFRFFFGWRVNSDRSCYPTNPKETPHKLTLMSSDYSGGPYLEDPPKEIISLPNARWLAKLGTPPPQKKTTKLDGFVIFPDPTYCTLRWLGDLMWRARGV